MVNLIKYFEELHKERENDNKQHRHEKQLVIFTLDKLEIQLRQYHAYNRVEC